MTPQELIKKLQKLPQDLPIRLVDKNNDGENIWLRDVEVSETGDSGYEVSGEIRLVGSE